MYTGKILFQVAAAAFIITSIYFGISARKTDTIQKNIFKHRNEYHEVILPLLNEKIVIKQSAENLIKKYPPTTISNHDNYQTLQYFNPDEEVDDCCVVYSYYIHIIAQNDMLMKAFASEGFFAETEYVFFDAMDDIQENAYWDSRMSVVVTLGKN